MWSYLKYLRYLFLKKYPAEITFFITAKCNFRCVHCFNWQNIANAIPKNELTITEIEKVTLTIPHFLRLSLSGGEPFLRDDLIQICQSFYKNCQVKFITIPTNGSLTEKIIKDTEQILKTCPKLFLNIGLSLDNLGAERDIVVGRKNTFESLIKTARGLKDLQKKYNNLGLGVITTQISQNEHKLEEIYQFALNTLNIDNFGFNIARTMNFGSKVTAMADLDIYKKFTKKLIQEKKSSRFNFPLARFFVVKRNLIFERVLKTYQTKKYQSACFSGRLRVVINEKGDVYPCETFQFCSHKGSFLMGNLKDYGLNFKNLFFSSSAQKIKNDIKKTKCFCAHECDMETNILFNIKFLPRILWEAMKINLKK